MSNQYIQFDGDYYEAFWGLNTGLQAASEIANIFLSRFDSHLLARAGPALIFYRRYIDDGLIAVDGDRMSEDQVNDIVNGWHPCVTADPLVLSDTVDYLDLKLTVKHRGPSTYIDYSTFRKAMNSYNYVPRDAAHAVAVFSSIVKGEACRLLRTNRSEKSFLEQVAFFKRKLVARGFGNALIDRALNNMTFPRKRDILKKNKTKKKKPLVFTYLFSKTLAKARIDASLRKHASLIHKYIPDCKITSAGKYAPNLFRLMYSSTWHSGG